MKRADAIESIVNALPQSAVIVSALGFISRDLFALLPESDRIFCCMGSMGSVAPFTLGLAMAGNRKIVGIEGDGSLLMNLGSLVTIKRYGTPMLTLIVVDNRCYESTGGQPSQPATLLLENIPRSIGLDTHVCGTPADIEQLLRVPMKEGPRVIIAKVEKQSPAPRVGNAAPDFAENLYGYFQKSSG